MGSCLALEIQKAEVVTEMVEWFVSVNMQEVEIVASRMEGVDTLEVRSEGDMVSVNPSPMNLNHSPVY